MKDKYTYMAFPMMFAMWVAVMAMSLFYIPFGFILYGLGIDILVPVVLWAASPVCLLLSIFYFGRIFFLRVTLTDDGVTLKHLMGVKNSFAWSDIREVRVEGEGPNKKFVFVDNREDASVGPPSAKKSYIMLRYSDEICGVIAGFYGKEPVEVTAATEDNTAGEE